eukprot:1159554-Pelagomonas_calceolata.AAC.5
MTVSEVVVQVLASQGRQEKEQRRRRPTPLAVVNGIVQAVIGHIPHSCPRKQRQRDVRREGCEQGCAVHGILVVAAVEQEVQRDAPVRGHVGMESKAMDEVLQQLPKQDAHDQ